MNIPIPVNEPLLDGDERKYLNQCIDTGWVSSEGPFVPLFEEKFAARVGRRHGISVCNGSAALDLAVVALGIGKGDKVILPTFTIISCAAAIVRAGAIPVVIDSDSLSWNMDITRIEEKICPRTKAIMAVHIYGLPIDMEPLLQLAKKYELKIIEDAAEMHGQTYYGQPCGSFGDISTFSFYSNKNITTGEGGMIVTDDDILAKQCRSLRNLCFQEQKRFVHEDLGWNFRMSNIQAAIGVAQVDRLDETVAKKRYIGRRYTELLANERKLQLPLPKTKYAENIYWVYGVVLSEDVPFDAEEVMRRMSKYHIGTRPFFWSMHEQPVFRKMGLFSNDILPVAENLSRRGFYIPSGIAITDQQINRVVEVMCEVLN